MTTYLRTREFEDSPSAHRYATHFGGAVELITPPGQPHYYRVWVFA